MLSNIRQKLEILRARTDFSSLTSQPGKTLEFTDPNLHLLMLYLHRFQIGLVLNAPELEAVESKYNIRLPEEYRAFLLEVGNGGLHSDSGPGPGYELYSLNKSLQRLEGVLSEPFPYTEAWKPDSEAFSSVEDYEEDLFAPYHVQGTLEVAFYGCTLYGRLVVTGPERGHIWMDDRGSDYGLSPYTEPEYSRVDFLTWYNLWLDREIERLTPIWERTEIPPRGNLTMQCPKPSWY